MLKRVVIALLIVIFFVSAGLYYWRHNIIKHAFDVSISKKTNSTVKFNIGYLYYDVFSSTITFKNSDFTFNNVTINNEKTVELSDFKFYEIGIHNLNIFRLIFKNEVVAKKFNVIQPEFWFKENDKPKPFKEKPKEIINNLKKHPELLGNLVIIVDEIEITHGKVDLGAMVNENDISGSVNFKLILKDFDTKRNDIFNDNKFLFAENHFFKLSNFLIEMPNGNTFGFDSLVFSSKNDGLLISNIETNYSMDKKSSPIESIKGHIKTSMLYGINLTELQVLHDIKFDSLAISDCNIDLVERKEANTLDSGSVNQTKFSLNSIFLGKLIMDNISLNALSASGDSLFSIDDFNFSISDIFIDSTAVSQGKPEVDYKSLIAKAKNLKFDYDLLGINLNIGRFDLNEKLNLFQVTDVIFNDRIDGIHSYHVLSDTVSIYGASIYDIIHKNQVNLGISLVKPNVNINIEHITPNKGSKKSIADNYNISFINIIDGNFHIFEKDKFNVDANKVTIKWDSINYNNHTTFSHLNYNSIHLNFEDLDARLFTSKASVSIGETNLQNSTVLINHFNSRIEDKKGVFEVYFKKLLGENTSISDFVNNKKIGFDGFTIENPKIFAQLNSKKTDKIKKHDSDIELSVNVKNLKLLNGFLDLKVDNGDSIALKTDLNIVSDNIDITSFNDFSWIEKLGWDIELYNSSLLFEHYFIQFDKLNTNKYEDYFIGQNIKVQHRNILKKNARFDINNLEVSLLKLNGINYNQIISGDKPVVDKMLIQNPNVDITIDSETNNTFDNKKIKLHELPFELNELELDNLKLNVKSIRNNDVTQLGIESFSFIYQLDSSKNIFKDIDFINLEELSFSNISKNHSITLESLRLSKNKSILVANGLSICDTSANTKASWSSYRVKDIKLTDIFVSSTLPVVVSFDSVLSAGVDIDIATVSEKNDNKPKRSNLSISMPDFISSFSVNKFIGNDIFFNHRKLTDSISEVSKLKKVKLDIDSVSIDSSVLQNKDFLFAKRLSLDISNNRFVSKDSLYSTSVECISFLPFSKQIIVDSLEMMPRYDDDQFFKKAVYQTGRMKVKVGRINCDNFEISEYFDNDLLHIGSVNVYNLDTKIFRNKLYSMDPNAFKKMPQEAIRDIKQNILIDSVITHDAYIQYKEIVKKSVVPGMLFLDSFNLKLYNINNYNAKLDSNSILLAKLRAKFMGKALLNIKAGFNILSQENEFWVKGNMDKIDFSEVNSLTQNLVGITMARGSGSLEIPLIKGNETNSEGEILFKYRKLKIELYDRDKARTAKGLTGSMANLLLNDIFIKSNNPGFLGKTRPGEVYFKRNKQKSVVQYIWKSIMSGLMSTMGYNNKEQRQELRAWKKSKKAK